MQILLLAVMLSIILYTIMLAISILGAGKFKNKKDLIKKLGFKDVSVTKGFATAVFYVLILFGVTILISIVMNAIGFGEDAARTSNIISQVNVLEVVLILSIASFVEEIFFRGFLQKHTNIIAASFIFAMFHIGYGSLTEVIGVFILGIILGIEFKKTKSLFSPILTHLMYNLITVMLIFGV